MEPIPHHHHKQNRHNQRITPRSKREIKLRKNPTQNIKPTMDLKITAIVSLYNSGRWLHNRIHNLMSTTSYRKGELLIYCVNAQSPDPQDDQIANKFAGYTNFHYEILPQTCTVYAAWNHAIKKTDTKYLTNANADDITAPDAYDKLIHAIESTDSILAYSDWLITSQENQQWKPGEIIGNVEHLGHYNPEGGQLSCGHFPVWCRSLHEKVGYFDPNMKALGDADLWFRAWKMGVRNFTYYGEPLGGYLWRSGQNLWHRVPDDSRAKEWTTLFSRQPVKLDF